jgi:hypothetical protein
LAAVAALLFTAIGGYITDTGRALLESTFSDPSDVAGKISGDPAFKVIGINRNSDVSGNELFVPGIETDQDRALIARTRTPIYDGNDPRLVLPQERERWIISRGVYETMNSYHEIVLEGRRSNTVQIINMKPRFDGGRCSKPSSDGVLVEEGSAGSEDKIPLEINFDEPNPIFKIRDKETNDLTPYFQGPNAKDITLERNEKQTITISAVTRTRACVWRIEVSYVADGKRQSTIISYPGGRPFRITGTLSDRSSYRAVYVDPLLCPPGKSRRLESNDIKRFDSGDRSVACSP